MGSSSMVDRAEDVAHRVQDLLGPQHTGRADGRVQQPQDGALRQRLRPVGEFVESPGRLQPADQRAHRRAGDADDLVAAGVQCLDHPDVGIAAGAAAAERQRHPGPVCDRRGKFARRASILRGRNGLHRAGRATVFSTVIPIRGAEPGGALAAFVVGGRVRGDDHGRLPRQRQLRPSAMFQLPAVPDGDV